MPLTWGFLTGKTERRQPKPVGWRIKAHTFSSNISLRRTTPDKIFEEDNRRSTGENTTTQSTFSIGGELTTLTNKVIYGGNLEEYDVSTFGILITTEAMNKNKEDSFHDAYLDGADKKEKP